MVDRNALIQFCTQLKGAIDGSGAKCFLCFGTLLFFLRDHVFNVESDVDIGIIGDAHTALSAFSGAFQPVKTIIDDSTGMPLNVNMRASYGGTNVDLYFWHKRDGFYYHTYDHTIKNPANGILPEYHFKGVDADIFDVPPAVIHAYQNDIRYGRAMNNNGTWNLTVPGIEEECIDLPVPFGYGKALDQWYPNWSVPNPTYGVSECTHLFTVNSCKGIKWDL